MLLFSLLTSCADNTVGPHYSKTQQGVVAGGTIGTIAGLAAAGPAGGAIGLATGSIVGASVGSILDEKAGEIQQEVQPVPAQIKPIQQLHAIQVNLKGTAMFPQDSAALTVKAKQGLQKVAHYLKKHPDWHVIAVGHPDNKNKDRHNALLAKARALSTAQYLQKLGIKKSRIKVAALPVRAHDPVALARARSVELILQPPKDKFPAGQE